MVAGVGGDFGGLMGYFDDLLELRRVMVRKSIGWSNAVMRRRKRVDLLLKITRPCSWNIFHFWDFRFGKRLWAHCTETEQHL